MSSWLRRIASKILPRNIGNTHEAGRWMLWMYQSAETNGGVPLLLFVYEWDRAGFCAPWVKIVYSCDEDAAWDGDDPSWEVFEHPYLFSKLVASGEARRVGPVPFAMPPPGEGEAKPKAVAAASED